MTLLQSHPPNGDSFSLDVIGTVIPRANPGVNHVTVKIPDDKPTLDSIPRPKRKQYVVRSVRTIGKRKKTDADDIRRERDRAIQARHRKTQATLLVRLEKDIANLLEDVHTVDVRRQDICTDTPILLDLWFAAMEYFRFFQVGFNTPPPGLLAFLDRIIAPDVTDGPICGADTLVKNWAMLSLSFEDITVQLERLDRAGDDLLVATTTTSITIRSETLRRVFPHLLGHDDISLATKLQDQRIVMRSSVRFDWDSSTRRIVRMLSQADMLTPILHLLGNVQDVSRVFDEALVTPEFRLRSM
ncbi:hypothetical protein P3T76_000712 [Phytophthora citrophthora]|uniref:BZIP transcription factor n=1 Tax=Phytophthora citrophthora TaxID=4793 RepID=A0AAD9H2B5_9STRA|nr:hypothetical protein P3T76_000712 [Phytophthora citrophthora]